MEKRDYFRRAVRPIKIIKNNPIICLPDLIFYICAGLISYLFLNVNGLTSLFHNLESFTEQIKTIVGNSPLLIKLIATLVGFIILNVIIGLGTECLRLTLISKLVKNKKLDVYKDWKSAGIYFYRLFSLKVIMLFVYAIPAIVLVFIGIVYKPVLLISLGLTTIILLFIRFSFLFNYPILFLDNIRNPFEILKKSVVYFRLNKLHILIVGIFILIIETLISLAVGVFPILISKFGIVATTTMGILGYTIIKSLIDIYIKLWSNIFLFENYD